MYITIVVDLLATHHSFTLCSQLTEQPQRSLTLQRKGIIYVNTFATTYTRSNLCNITHRYFGALRYTITAMTLNIILGNHTHIHGSIEPLMAICSKTLPSII